MFGIGCCNCGCSLTVGLEMPTNPCSPPTGEYGAWDYYGAYSAAVNGLSSVITAPNGSTYTGGTPESGTYTIVISEPPSICVTSLSSMGGYLPANPCLYYDNTARYTFPVTCPGSNVYEFPGPQITRWSCLVTFNVLYGHAAYGTANDYPFNSPCYSARLNTGQTWSYFDPNIPGVRDSIPPPYAVMQSDGSSSFSLVLVCNGPPSMALTGTVAYTSVVCGAGSVAITPETVTIPFSLNFCDGPSQEISVILDPGETDFNDQVSRMPIIGKTLLPLHL